mmetsp:Transcript_37342/g.66857  ORF Transcript_37342/g.66857 Transcript_37342/m.66857 type:complete len:630 (-) Transcript_37342:75-1964(-)
MFLSTARMTNCAVSRQHIGVLLCAVVLAYGFVVITADNNSSQPRLFELPQFSLSQLKDPSPDEVQDLRRAISDVGLFAISNAVDVPSSGAALQRYAACVARGIDGGALHTVLEDGARKTTVAAVTNGTRVESLPAEVTEACPDFADAAKGLRASVDHAGRVYARLLDILVQGAPPRGPVPGGAGNSYVDAVLRAEALEHFHLFQHDGERDEAAEPAIQLHSDMGLFIIMTAAEYVELTSGERVVGGGPQTGFYLELASGEMVQPVIQPGSLLVMNGDGAEKWVRLSKGAFTRPYSPAHEVILPEMEGLARVWFGRMFLPPSDAVHVEDGRLTFGEYRRQTMDAFRYGHPEEASSAGCSPGRRGLVEVTKCSAGKIYCWMSCLSVPEDAECSKDEILCGQMDTGKLWPEDFLDPATGDPTHCYACGLFCPEQEQLEHDFCNTQLPATTMWMAGFQIASPTDGCVAYLFQPWVLSSAAKFAVACIGTFLMGIFVEFLVSVRRQVLSWEPPRRFIGSVLGRRVLKTCSMLTLYAVQVTLGYLLMLVAMTYQVELFLMVIFGLMAGHGIFNLKARVGESADACCQGQDPDTDDADGGKFIVKDTQDPNLTETPVVGWEEPARAPGHCCSHAQP